MSELLTVITANTHMGRMLEDLEPVSAAGVLLLQEVHPERDDLDKKLRQQTELHRAAAIGEFGLAIAVGTGVRVGAVREYVLQDRGPVGKALTAMERQLSSAAAFRTRARGLVTAELTTADGAELTVGTTHPIIPFKWRARRRQVIRLGEILSGISGPLIIGGDMNHWPAPHSVDLEMYARADLQAVDFGPAPTYDISASKHAWIGRLAGRFIQFNGQMDALLYRGPGVTPENSRLINTKSDHRALRADLLID